MFVITIILSLCIFMGYTNPVSANGSDTGWVMTCEPEFIMIGGNVTLTIVGLTNVYCYLVIYDPNETVWTDSFIALDSKGRAIYELNIDVYDLPGVYKAEIYKEEMLLASCNFLVIYDDEVLQWVEHNWAKEQITELWDRVSMYSRLSQRAVNMYDDAMTWVTVFAGITTILSIYIVATHRKYWAWKLALTDKDTITMDKINDFLDPPPKGSLLPYSAHMRVNLRNAFEERYAEERNEVAIQPTLIFPDNSQEEGWNAIISNDIDINAIKLQEERKLEEQRLKLLNEEKAKRARRFGGRKPKVVEEEPQIEDEGNDDEEGDEE
jgi:hypothetical protein